MTDERLNTPYRLLRLTYGLVPIIAGLDKFTNVLTDWTQYLSPWATNVLPVSPSLFMMIVGVIEIIAGLLVLSPLVKVGAYVVSAWLIAIAINLLTTGQYFDIAVRDVVMSIGAFALGRLATIEHPATSPSVGATRRLAHP